MTKLEALIAFNEVDDMPEDDKIMRRQAWADYTDMLYKDGAITEHQNNNWNNPF